jgi:hypothetical protein
LDVDLKFEGFGKELFSVCRPDGYRVSRDLDRRLGCALAVELESDLADEKTDMMLPCFLASSSAPSIGHLAD